MPILCFITTLHHAIYSHAYVTVSQGLNGNNWLMLAGMSYTVIDSFIMVNLVALRLAASCWHELESVLVSLSQ